MWILINLPLDNIFNKDEKSKRICWAVSFVLGHLVVRGHIDNREDVRIREPWANYGHEGYGG